MATERPAGAVGRHVGPIPLSAPHLRLRQRLRQDDPRLAPGDDHRRRSSSGLILIGVSAAIVDRVRHARVAPGARRPRRGGAADPRRAWPARPINVETLGGYIQYKYGTFFPLVVSLWSILALSGTLAAEARRGSLEFVAADADDAAPDRAREAGRPRDVVHRDRDGRDLRLDR